MHYYLGFDGGGTKTECVLTDRSGRILAQSVAGPSNPLRIGFAAACNSLTAAADHVLSAAKIDAGQITAVCAGLAGAGRKHVVKRVMGFLVETFPRAVVHVTTDMEVALEAAAGPHEGLILIAGTGSSAFGRNAAGKTMRAGGYGPWLGGFTNCGTAHTSLVNVPSTELTTMDRVEPGDPTDSWLMHKLDGTQGTFTGQCTTTCGSSMPFGSPLLPLSTRDAIRTWITNGALNDCP